MFSSAGSHPTSCPRVLHLGFEDSVNCARSGHPAESHLTSVELALSMPLDEHTQTPQIPMREKLSQEEVKSLAQSHTALFSWTKLLYKPFPPTVEKTL